MSKQKVTVEMYDVTIDDIDYIKEFANLSTGSDAVKISVDLARTIADIVKNGGRIVIEEGRNKRSELKVDGFRSAV